MTKEEIEKAAKKYVLDSNMFLVENGKESDLIIRMQRRYVGNFAEFENREMKKTLYLYEIH